MTDLESVLGQPLVHRLGWTLLHFLWQGAVGGLLLAGLLSALRRRSANARYLAACAGLALMAALPVITYSAVPAPAPDAVPGEASSAAAAKATPTPPAVPPGPASGDRQPAEPAGGPAASALEPPVGRAETPWPLDALQPLLPWVVVAWLGGMALFAVRLCGGWVYVQGLRRRQTRLVADGWSEVLARLCRRLRVRRPVYLLESALLQVPSVLGWLRPVILLPASALAELPASQLEAILAHELAHIRRHDYLVNLLQSVVETLLFYHPAVWWVSRRIRQERENCCDDVAVEACGCRLTYARALAAMEQLRGKAVPLAAAVNSSPLLERVRRLLGVSAPSPRSFTGWLAGVAALATVAAVGAALTGALAAADAEAKGGPMTVTGRVLDADGKPVAGADVAVLGRPRSGIRSGARLVHVEVLGQGKSDGEGRYRLRAPRTSRERYSEAYVLARALGHSLGQHHLDPDARQPEVSVRLAREQVLRGRLLDLQGQAAGQVKLWAVRAAGPLPDGKHFRAWFDRPPEGLRSWFTPLASDAQGRFTLRNLGPGWSVKLQAVDDRFARQSMLINPEASERAVLEQYRRVTGGSGPFMDVKADQGRAEDFTWVLRPARVFEGTVTYGDSGKPVPGARLVVFAGQNYPSLISEESINGAADADGRFRLVPHVGDHFILVAYPPDDQPYLLQTKSFDWVQKDAVRQEVHLSLTRGIQVQGKVTEAASGNPVSGASVEFVPRRADNPQYREGTIGPTDSLKQIGVSGPDGKFQVTVLPGPGNLLVNGPTPDYMHVETSRQQLAAGKTGGVRYYPNGLVGLDLRPEIKAHEVSVRLRRGVTVKGNLVGPDGKPVAQAQVLSTSYIPSGYTLETPRPLEAKAGRFEVPACDPDKAQAVYFLDAKNQLGARVELSGKQADQRLTVCLERCGSATARFVDDKGKPVAGFKPFVEMVLTPGVNWWEAMSGGQLAADVAWMVNLDRQRHRNLRPDARGQFTLPTLIPGATYRLLGQTPQRGIFNLHKTFTVEAGKILDLKDIPVKTPN